MKKFILLICLVLSVQTVLLSQTILIPYGTSWKYKDNGSDQGSTWKDVSFNDASWASGNSQFGYGEGDESTIVNACGTVSPFPTCTNKYITTYFRTNVNIASVSAFQSFTFNLLRDDGIVLYINGTEVYRNNMPAGTIAYNTAAASAASDDGNTVISFTLSAAQSGLISGNNVIAAEVHQVNGSSSDLSFTLQMLGILNGGLPIITRGPYLQMVNPQGITIRYRTDINTNSKIFFGTDSTNLNQSLTINGSTNEHTVVLSGLQPFTRYYYAIANDNGIIASGNNYYFKTSPVTGNGGKYRFWVTGDCGTGYPEQAANINQFNNYAGNSGTNGWLILGDNAYNGGYDTEYTTNFFEPYQNGQICQKIPLWPVPGNHDYDNNATNQVTHAVPYYNIFNLPTQGEAGGVPSNNEAYYSYNYGNIHFLALDSYGKESGTTRLYDTTGAQVQWIKADLAANTLPWVVAYWHHPPFTMGSHNSDTEAELVNMRTNFIRILERNGVDLILCGHSHSYERSKLMKGHYGLEPTFNANTHNVNNSSGLYDGSTGSCPYLKDTIHQSLNGTVYIVSGSAGKTGGTSAGYPHNAMYYSNTTNAGSLILEFDNNRLDAKWLCSDGLTRDNFTIIKHSSKVRNITINEGDSIQLTASWPGIYHWNNGASSNRSQTVSPVVNATYVVSDQYQCLADTFKITVLPIIPSFSSSTQQVCEGAQVSFINTSSTNVSSVLWSFPGSTTPTSTSFNPVVTYPTAGSYNVTLTVYRGFADSSLTINSYITVLPNLVPSVVITNNTLNNPICIGDNVSFSAQAQNAGVGAVYEWYVNSNLASTGVNFTTNTLSNGAIVSCKLIVSGSCYTATSVNSNNITVSLVNCSIPTTQLRTQDCGKMNFALNSSIICNTVASATQYEFEMTHTVNGIVSSKIASTNYIVLNTASPAIQYGSIYNVRVRAKVGGVFGAFGPVCQIGTICDPAICGVPTTQVRSADCGKLNFSLSGGTLIADAIAGASSYDFEFTSVPSGVFYALKSQSSNSLLLSSVTPLLQWGQQYSVKVRAKIGAFTGNYGNACTIGFIPDPAISGVPNTQLTAASCNNVQLSLTSSITCTVVSGANSYQWQFKDASNINVIATQTTSGTTLNLSTVSGLNWGTNYNVTVRASIGSVQGNYATNCLIGFIPDPAISGVPNTKLRTSDCGKLNLASTSSIMADAVSGANQYEFEFSNSIGGGVFAVKTQAGNVLVLNTVTPLLLWSNQYNVRVRARIGSVWGNFSTTCLIGLICNPALCGVPATKLRNSDCGKLNLLLSTGSVLADAVAGANQYEFEITNNSTGNIHATVIRNSSQLIFNTVTPLLNSTVQYSIRVRAAIAGVWGVYGTTCNVGFVFGSRETEENLEVEGDLDLNTVSVFPNPFVNELFCQLSGSVNGLYSIKVIDLNGRILNAYMVNSGESDGYQILKLDYLSPGIYFMEILIPGIKEDELKRIKIIKSE